VNSGSAPAGGDGRNPPRGPAGSNWIAAGLPPQPPLGTANGTLRSRPPAAGQARAGAGFGQSPTAVGARGPNPNGNSQVRAATSKGDLSRPESVNVELAQSDLSKGAAPPLDRARSGVAKSDLQPKIDSAKEGGASSAPVPLLSVPSQAVAGRGTLTGTPSSTSARPAALSPDPSSLLEARRITPRSPRAALEPDHVPVPTDKPRPSRRARNPLVIIGNAIFTVLLLTLIIGGGAIVIGKTRFEAPGPLQEDKVVTIPGRSGMIEIADLLKREGVIDEHRFVFIGGVLALKARSELKAGEYLFPKRASVRDVVDTIVEGKVVQHQMTIPEGLTSEQIVARLLENEILTGTIKDVPREGILLPDSYHFQRGFSREQMIQRMRQAQDRLVREAWERRSPDLPIKTPEQLIILASIIEKETGRPEERTRVAAVFANRLKQKMKLQSDPTIIYGLVFGKGSLGRAISKADIAQPTPYNTYIIDGLPPGPIGNPGRASIEAAANPARTKDLFFVADGTGGHAFAETYELHQKNVARLRVIEQEQRGEGTAPSESQTAPTAPPRPAGAQRSKRSANGTPRSAGATQ
jgi:UPF0755 protein